jgi:hypothetical protein
MNAENSRYWAARLRWDLRMAWQDLKRMLYWLVK